MVETVAATSPMFAPLDVLRMRTYDLMASPLIYPGQKVSAQVMCTARKRMGQLRLLCGCVTMVKVTFWLIATGRPKRWKPGEDVTLDWTLPDTGAQPIAELGLVINGQAGSTVNARPDGMVWHT